jgi:predicted RNA binding protein YcfA (HicA-like mRNA interferase family)
MRLPRDLSGHDLVAALARLGYAAVRQVGSHVRLTTPMKGEHHVTIPMHDPIKPGTLNNILKDIASHHGLSRDDLLQLLFG